MSDSWIKSTRDVVPPSKFVAKFPPDIFRSAINATGLKAGYSRQASNTISVCNGDSTAPVAAMRVI